MSFPYAKKSRKPDIHVKYRDTSELYVECYHYSKWWWVEHLVEEVLSAMDRNLRIERVHNVAYENNPFGDSDEAVIKVLAKLRKYLAPDRLADLRRQASEETPVEVCEIGDFNVLLYGCGAYSARSNRHGEPINSWPVFRNEILKEKKCKNDLQNHRPNLLMVNCLGIDFQASLNDSSEVSCLPRSIDEVWFCTCGINDKIENCRRLVVPNPSC